MIFEGNYIKMRINILHTLYKFFIYIREKFYSPPGSYTFQCDLCQVFLEISLRTVSKTLPSTEQNYRLNP